MKAWGITDVGLRRLENQDTFAFEISEDSDTIIAVVCDGMGGANGGQLASSLAVSVFMDEIRLLIRSEMLPEQKREMESFCVARANSAVYRRSMESDGYRGMGTTLVSAVVSPYEAVVCNVGDSRAYHLDRNGIRRITRDHSVVQSLLESGDITPEEARTHPNRNLITRALGPESEILCDSFDVALAEGDYLLLCSDGLTGTVRDEELFDAVCSAEDGARALEHLIALSKERGAPDNVTAVLILNG